VSDKPTCSCGLDDLFQHAGYNPKFAHGPMCPKGGPASQRATVAAFLRDAAAVLDSASPAHAYAMRTIRDLEIWLQRWPGVGSAKDHTELNRGKVVRHDRR
jgi:hypothetical protein